MAIEAIGGSGSAAFWRLPARIAGIVRFVRAVLRSYRAENELNGLSDHYLHDIGVDRRQISELVKRAATREHLLDAGWRSPSRR